MRVGRIELPSNPWQGLILPLNYTRVENHSIGKGRKVQEKISNLTGSVPTIGSAAEADAQSGFDSWPEAHRASSGGNKCAPQFVPPPGIEPGITVSKTVVISVSPREQFAHHTV